MTSAAYVTVFHAALASALPDSLLSRGAIVAALVVGLLITADLVRAFRGRRAPLAVQRHTTACGCVYEEYEDGEFVLVEHCGLTGHVFDGRTTCEHCGIEAERVNDIIPFCPGHGPDDEVPHLFAVAVVNHDSYGLMGYLPYELALEYVERLTPCVKYDQIEVTPVRPTFDLRKLLGAYEVCLNRDGSVAQEGWIEYTSPDGLAAHWWRGAVENGDDSELGSVRGVGWDRAEAFERAQSVLASPPVPSPAEFRPDGIQPEVDEGERMFIYEGDDAPAPIRFPERLLDETVPLSEFGFFEDEDREITLSRYRSRPIESDG